MALSLDGLPLASGATFAIAAAMTLSLPAAVTPSYARDGYLYVTNLDPDGDNWLALRSEPTGRRGRRIARLGPDTLLAPSGSRTGPWLEVLVLTGPYRDETGWVHQDYVSCCRPLEY